MKRLLRAYEVETDDPALGEWELYVFHSFVREGEPGLRLHGSAVHFENEDGEGGEGGSVENLPENEQNAGEHELGGSGGAHLAPDQNSD